MPPISAVTVVDPVATAVALPSNPAPLATVTMPVSSLDHVTCVVMFDVVPSESRPVAVN